jgi:hypothetical protein
VFLLFALWFLLWEGILYYNKLQDNSDEGKVEKYKFERFIDNNEQIFFLPGELVFTEANATLKDRNGNVLANWY